MEEKKLVEMRLHFDNSCGIARMNAIHAPASSSPPKRENGFLPTAPEDEFMCGGFVNLLRFSFSVCARRERREKTKWSHFVFFF